MDDTTSGFEIKLESAGNYKYSIFPPPHPPPPQKKNVEARLDHFWSRINKFDQGGARGGAIAVPNPRDRRSVGKKVQISILFVQDCNVWSAYIAAK